MNDHDDILNDSLVYNDEDPYYAADDRYEIMRIFEQMIPLNEPVFMAETSLHMNATRPQVIYVLMRLGADPNVRNGRQRTPLMLAAEEWHGANVKAVNLLLDYGADPSLQDNEGRTVWDYALKGPDISEKIVVCLLKRVGIPCTAHVIYAAEYILPMVQIIILCAPVLYPRLLICSRVWLNRDLLRMLYSYLTV